MQLILGAFLLFGFLFLLGCAQNQVPSACAPLTPGEAKDNCIYRESVISQEPFRCYNISDEAKRSACLGDSVSAEAKQKIKKPPSPKPPATIVQNRTEQQPSENRTQVAQQYAECYATSLEEVRDACLSGLALDRRDISICLLVSGEEFRGQCVVNVAQLIRNPSICQVLNESTHRAELDLCNTHAKAGEIT